MKERITIDNQLVVYNCFQGGKSALTLVFLHGWRSDKEIWRSIIEKLQTTSHKLLAAYVLDLSGFGESSVPKEPWTVGDYASLVKEFISKLDLRDVILIGHSFGGRISIKLAVEYPNLINKLVLVDSAGFVMSSIRKTFMQVFAKIIKPIFKPQLMQALREKIYQKIGAEDYLATPELQKTFVNVVNEDLTEDMKKIKVPTLIIWGENDREIPVGFGRKTNELIEGSKLEILKGAGHFSFLDQPEEFAKLLGDFVAR